MRAVALLILAGFGTIWLPAGAAQTQGRVEIHLEPYSSGAMVDESGRGVAAMNLRVRFWGMTCLQPTTIVVTLGLEAFPAWAGAGWRDSEVRWEVPALGQAPSSNPQRAYLDVGWDHEARPEQVMSHEYRVVVESVLFEPPCVPDDPAVETYDYSGLYAWYSPPPVDPQHAWPHDASVTAGDEVMCGVIEASPSPWTGEVRTGGSAPSASGIVGLAAVVAVVSARRWLFG